MAKCLYCKVGDMAPGFATSASALRSLTMVVKGVPADVCGNCGEGWYSREVVKRLEEMTDAARDAGAEVVIRRYDAGKPVRGGGRALTFTRAGVSTAKPERGGGRPPNGSVDVGSQAIVVSDYPVSAERHCFLCKNDALKPGVTDTSLTRGDVVMVVKGVPAQVCTNCGEAYLERGVYEQMKVEFKAAERAGVEFVTRRYAAAGQAAVKRNVAQASGVG